MPIPSRDRFRLWLLMPSRTTIISKLGNKLRRWFHCTLNPAYIEQQQQLREGECVRCGRCCRLVFKCPFLGGTDENPLCLIYEKGRPFQCAAFPIDPRDLADVDFQCGYSFAVPDELAGGGPSAPLRPRDTAPFPYPVYRA